MASSSASLEASSPGDERSGDALLAGRHGAQHSSTNSLHRRPYTSATHTHSREPTAGAFRDQNLAIRYRFFCRLDRGAGSLTMPDHIVPLAFFSVLPFDEFKDTSGKQSSIVTIFSIWNTMMGTSLLVMPWALQQAGFAFGIFVMVAMAAISFYTAYRVVESPSGLTLDVDSTTADFSDVCRYFWGKYGSIVATFFSLTVLLGGVIVYWVLMSNFLFFTGNVIYEAAQRNTSISPIISNRTFACDIFCPDQRGLRDELSRASAYLSQLQTDISSAQFFRFDNLWKLQGSVPIYLAFLTFPLLNFKSPTFFTKFNMLGTVSVIYLLSFVLSKVFECGWNLNFWDTSSEHFAKLFNWKFPALSGTLALSFFIHNAVLTILRNQKYPENNVRDLSIGYALSACCYLFIAVVFFGAFPTYRNCISDNLLNNFGTSDVMSAVARLFLFVQMLSVLPLLMFLIRSQFFYALMGSVYPGLGYVCLLNVAVVLIAVAIAILYPHVGGIIRYVGSFSGLVYVFALPCAVHLKRRQMLGPLRRIDVAVHGSVIFLGIANFVSQFFIG